MAKFLFENVLTRFGCPNILMSDQGMHFFKETIGAQRDQGPRESINRVGLYEGR